MHIHRTPAFRPTLFERVTALFIKLKLCLLNKYVLFAEIYVGFFALLFLLPFW
jgi:hypothetical protein